MESKLLRMHQVICKSLIRRSPGDIVEFHAPRLAIIIETMLLGESLDLGFRLL
jgi:hypothetical protein